jgi:uncharacterized membrane protein (Fun14 family)
MIRYGVRTAAGSALVAQFTRCTADDPCLGEDQTVAHFKRFNKKLELNAPSATICATSTSPWTNYFDPPEPDEYPQAAGAGGIGFLAGYCSGVTVRSVGRAGAFLSGGIFMGLSAMEQSGYISINWKKIERDISKTLDVNDDGKLDQADMHALALRSVKYFTHHNAIPLGSFTAGLAWGFRSTA